MSKKILMSVYQYIVHSGLSEKFLLVIACCFFIPVSRAENNDSLNFIVENSPVIAFIGAAFLSVTELRINNATQQT